MFIVIFDKIKILGRNPILGKSPVFRRIVISDRVAKLRRIVVNMKPRDERYRREIWENVKEGKGCEVDLVYSD